MKQIFNLLALLILFSCSNPKHDGNRTDKNTLKTRRTEVNKISNEEFKQAPEDSETLTLSNDFQKQELESEFEMATLYKLEDTITADFNGDGNTDKAFFVRETETSGIVIKHGFVNTEERFGFGKQFAHLKDFNWVDYWGLTEDSSTYEILFNEAGIYDTITGLENPSIVVRKEEVGGGLITFINGQYKWIHQSD